MLRVCHVVSSLNLGGAERLVLDLAAIQRKNHIDSRILSLGPPDELLVPVAAESAVPVGFAPNSLGRFRRSASAASTPRSRCDTDSQQGGVFLPGASDAFSHP